MNRLTGSPDRKQFGGRPPAPGNKWPTHPPTPAVPFGPQFATQRLFTPRGSYLSQPEDSFVFSQSLQMNPNYGQHYYESPPMRPPDTNRPVYSTPGERSVIQRVANQMQNQDIDALKTALENVYQIDGRSSISPESTVNTNDATVPSKTQPMDRLIAEMKILSAKQEIKKKVWKETNKQIEQLDIELKELDKKREMRDRLAAVRVKVEAEDEQLEKIKNSLLSEMDRCNKAQGVKTSGQQSSAMDSTVASDSSDVDRQPKTSTDNGSQQIPNPKPVERIHPSNTFGHKSSLKRPLKPAVTSAVKGNQLKKVRIMDDKTDSPNTTPTTKNLQKMPFRRTPIPSKATQAIGSPKVDRICRPQTPMSSGVRTSRPNRMIASRSKRMEEPVGNESLPPESTETQETASIDDTDDSGVFKELGKCVTNQTNSVTNVLDTTCDSANTDVEMRTEDQPKNDSQSEEPVEEQTEISEKTSSDTNNVKDRDKDKEIEVVDIDSGDEDYTEEPIKIKSEKPDVREESTSQQIDESSDPLRAHPSTSADASQASNLSNVATEQSADQSVAKRQYKFCGFDTTVYESSVPYSLRSFKPIAEPKIKKPTTSAFLLKSFKDYLIGSFTDFSVRRFHIEEKDNVLKYKGHEKHVMALLIVKCPKAEEKFILYTGGKDRTLRAFDLMSGDILNSIVLSDEINCLDYQWSHVFCALNDGLVTKVPLIHETNEKEYTQDIRNFEVNVGKRVLNLVCVRCVEPSDEDIEAVIALTPNKLRIINTRESVPKERRVLQSINVSVQMPATLRVVGSNLFMSYKMTSVKGEDNQSVAPKSKLAIFYMQNGIRDRQDRMFTVENMITSTEMTGDQMTLASKSGQIQCIDCTKLSVKWITYSEFKVTAAVQFGDRLVVATDKDQIECIYLDQSFIPCNDCGLIYARQVDFKKHIRIYHKSEAEAEAEAEAQVGSSETEKEN